MQRQARIHHLAVECFCKTLRTSKLSPSIKMFSVVSQSLELALSGRSVAVVGSCAARMARFFPGRDKPKRAAASEASAPRSSPGCATSILPSLNASGTSSASCYANWVRNSGLHSSAHVFRSSSSPWDTAVRRLLSVHGNQDPDMSTAWGISPLS